MMVQPSPEFRATLLAAANARLVSLQPALKCRMTHMGLQFVVRFDYASLRLLVYLRDSGELVAVSQAGRPTRLAAMRGHP